MKCGQEHEALDPKLDLIGAFIECGEYHRQTDHRCRLHDLLDRMETDSAGSPDDE